MISNHIKKGLYSLVISGAFVFAGCKGKSGAPAEGFKGKTPPPLPVSSVVIRPEALDNKIEVVGTILPNERVDLRSEIAARITGIYFKEGSRVQKGTLLVKLFDQDIRAQLKKATLQHELARKEEERKKKLLDISGISQEEYDLASNQAETLAADIELLRAQLRKTEIIAPFSGIVGLRQVSEGEHVSSTTLISTLQQTDPVKLEFDIPEKYAAIRPGSKISFTVAGSDKTFEGTVYAVEPTIDVATRTLKVRALSPNKEQLLKPGSFIHINLILGRETEAVLIPTESVVPGAKGQKVFVFRNGYALSKAIKTGFRNERNVQVTEGLESGDTLITSGMMQLKDSARVVIRKKKQG